MTFAHKLSRLPSCYGRVGVFRDLTLCAVPLSPMYPVSVVFLLCFWLLIMPSKCTDCNSTHRTSIKQHRRHCQYYQDHVQTISSLYENISLDVESSLMLDGIDSQAMQSQIAQGSSLLAERVALPAAEPLAIEVRALLVDPSIMVCVLDGMSGRTTVPRSLICLSHTDKPFCS